MIFKLTYPRSAFYYFKNEKALRVTQTLRAGCSKTQRKNFRPAADSLPGDAGRAKFNQLEMVTTFTHKPSLVRIDARNIELSWQQTHKHTDTRTNPQTQYTAPLSLARRVIIST